MGPPTHGTPYGTLHQLDPNPWDPLWAPPPAPIEHPLSQDALWDPQPIGPPCPRTPYRTPHPWDPPSSLRTPLNTPSRPPPRWDPPMGWVLGGNGGYWVK